MKEVALVRKRGQIWVETVIYTLIAFAMIGIVLAFAVPRIGEIQDRGIIEQSITMLEDMNTLISNIGSPGSQRVIDVKISKGELTINGADTGENANSINFEMESRYDYSQEGQIIKVGNVNASTEYLGDISIVSLSIEYENYNLTFNGQNQERIIGQAGTPYKILISNQGTDSNQNTIINFEII